MPDLPDFTKVFMWIFIAGGMVFGGGALAFAYWGTTTGLVALGVALLPPAIVLVIIIAIIITGLCWKA